MLIRGEEKVRLVDDTPRSGFLRGGLASLKAAYRAWRHERDLAVIARRLRRLSDRRLSTIGLSRSTLELDLERMARRAEQAHAQSVQDLRARAQSALPPPGENGDIPALPR